MKQQRTVQLELSRKHVSAQAQNKIWIEAHSEKNARLCVKKQNVGSQKSRISNLEFAGYGTTRIIWNTTPRTHETFAARRGHFDKAAKALQSVTISCRSPTIRFIIRFARSFNREFVFLRDLISSSAEASLSSSSSILIFMDVIRLSVFWRNYCKNMGKCIALLDMYNYSIFLRGPPIMWQVGHQVETAWPPMFRFRMWACERLWNDQLKLHYLNPGLPVRRFLYVLSVLGSLARGHRITWSISHTSMTKCK